MDNKWLRDYVARNEQMLDQTMPIEEKIALINVLTEAIEGNLQLPSEIEKTSYRMLCVFLAKDILSLSEESNG